MAAFTREVAQQARGRQGVGGAARRPEARSPRPQSSLPLQRAPATPSPCRGRGPSHTRRRAHWAGRPTPAPSAARRQVTERPPGSTSSGSSSPAPTRTSVSPGAGGRCGASRRGSGLAGRRPLRGFPRVDAPRSRACGAVRSARPVLSLARPQSLAGRLGAALALRGRAGAPRHRVRGRRAGQRPPALLPSRLPAGASPSAAGPQAVSPAGEPGGGARQASRGRDRTNVVPVGPGTVWAPCRPAGSTCWNPARTHLLSLASAALRRAFVDAGASRPSAVASVTRSLLVGRQVPSGALRAGAPRRAVPLSASRWRVRPTDGRHRVAQAGRTGHRAAGCLGHGRRPWQRGGAPRPAQSSRGLS